MCDEYYEERMKDLRRAAARNDAIKDLGEETESSMLLLPSQTFEGSTKPTAKRLVR